MAQSKPSTDTTSRTVKQPTTDRDAPAIKPNSERVRDNLAEDTGPEAPMPGGQPQVRQQTPGS